MTEHWCDNHPDTKAVKTVFFSVFQPGARPFGLFSHPHRRDLCKACCKALGVKT